MRTRIGRLALAAGAAALSLTLLGSAPAGAAGHPPESLAAAGSDTTYWMMKLISGHYVGSKKFNTLHDKVTMIPPKNASPFPLSVTVPKDNIHPAKTWNSSSPAATPPDGSSAGIAALVADTTGQISWARSSRGPNPGETGTMNFWAYALGALDWVKFPGSHSPAAGLTQQQLINIYTCNPSTGAPFISNWSQVPGGTAGAIVKYAPQTGSGTYSFFNSKLLNGSTIDKNCDNAHKSIFLQEHDARGVPTADKPNAIFAYDWARYRAQHLHFEADLTNGAVLGAFGVTNRIVPSATNVNEKSTRFFGTRYVYNVVRKTTHPKKATDQFVAVTNLIGVRKASAGGARYICSGAATGDIKKAGFVPLAKFGTGGVGLPSSYCRLNPKAL